MKMNGTMVWDPWREMKHAEDGLDELLNSLMSRRGDYPPANVWTGTDKIVFTFELPGMKAENLEVTAKQDTLTVKGERIAEPLPEGAALVRQERGTGLFSRSFALPFKVDSNNVEAHYQNGILTVVLPKAQDVMPKKISVVNG